VSRVLAFKWAARRRFLRCRRAAAGAQPSAGNRRRGHRRRRHGLYAQYCSVCHGENAVGGGVVPDLRASTFLGNDFFYEIVLNGAMKDAVWRPSSRCSIRRTRRRFARF
jgi:mono/diheme cytochrome c family protein